MTFDPFGGQVYVYINFVVSFVFIVAGNLGMESSVAEIGHILEIFYLSGAYNYMQ